MAPRAGPQTLCCQAPSAAAAGDHKSAAAPPPSLEPAPASAAAESVDFDDNRLDSVAGTAKGPGALILRSQSAHPLDPLGPTEIAVAIATVRAAGATSEV